MANEATPWASPCQSRPCESKSETSVKCMTYNSNHKEFRRFITSFIEIRESFDKKEYLYTVLS
ncbi:MAG: hypothetical protein ACM674_02780, partial [Bacteroidales bacterium]